VRQAVRLYHRSCRWYRRRRRYVHAPGRQRETPLGMATLVGARICGGVSPDKDADHPSGTTVSQILDFDAGQVLSFVTIPPLARDKPHWIAAQSRSRMGRF